MDATEPKHYYIKLIWSFFWRSNSLGRTDVCCDFSKVSISRIYIYTREDFFGTVEKWFSMKSHQKSLGVSSILKNAFGSTICLPYAYALPIYFFYMILMIFSCRWRFSAPGLETFSIYIYAGERFGKDIEKYQKNVILSIGFEGWRFWSNSCIGTPILTNESLL